MATKAEPDSNQLRVTTLGWAEIAKALFIARGIEDGLWHVGSLMHFGALTAGWEGMGNVALPTALVGVAGVALTKVEAAGPMVFDAAELRNQTDFGPPPVAQSPSAKRIAVKKRKPAPGQ